MATGLVCLELYKVLLNKPVEAYRNTFANLALPLFAMAEPIPPKVDVLFVLFLLLLGTAGLSRFSLFSVLNTLKDSEQRADPAPQIPTLPLCIPPARSSNSRT
jgi:hypothetical protein